MKSQSTATTDIAILDDGRLRLSVKHEIMRGVSPAMLLWWFSNLEGFVELEGRRTSRYQAWHPRDHLSFRYSRRGRGGAVGRGTFLHIREGFAGKPEFSTTVVTRIERLDEQGFVHCVRLFGIEIVRLEHRFRVNPEGTLDENSLTFGPSIPLIRWVFNVIVRPLVFPEKKAQAWLLHSVEEMGNLETFLPRLFEVERQGASPDR